MCFYIMALLTEPSVSQKFAFAQKKKKIEFKQNSGVNGSYRSSFSEAEFFEVVM